MTGKQQIPRTFPLDQPLFPRTPPSKHAVISDTRLEATPYCVSSQSLLASTNELQTHAKMAITLANEVQSGKVVDVPNLIEDKLTDEAISRGMHKAKFGAASRAAAAISVKVSDIFQKLKTESRTKGKFLAKSHCWPSWKTAPSSALSKAAQEWMKPPKSGEEDVADLFNSIGDYIRSEYDIDGGADDARVFSARFKDRSPANAAVNCIRKPDCAVLKRSVANASVAAWSDIRGLLEIKFSESPRAIRDAYRELLSCARMIFAAQHNRRFVLGATLIKEVMTFYIFDRSGVLSSEAFNINEQPEKLVRVVCGLLFVDEIRMGYDPTITKDDKGRYNILLNGTTYVCDEEPLYIEKSVRGRGTGCFITWHEGELAVIKDAWVDDSRKRQEHEILEKVKDVEGVVKIVDHEIVQVEGKDDTTATDRQRLMDNEHWKTNPKWKGFDLVETRTHRRLIMKPYGQPLENFASLTELLTAIKDIIKCIEDLIDRRVLHRDISLRNLILARSDPKDPTSRIRGYLIDFDYALDLDNLSNEVAKGARTGTLPFMALEMLEEEKSNKVPHAYYHDLESVFYSLCWLCTSQEGPNNTARKDGFDFDKSEVAKWAGFGMENPTLDDIRRCKAATVVIDGEFSSKVLDQFAPYFEPIKPCVVALRDVMINEGSNVNNKIYRSRLEHLKRALEEARQMGMPIHPLLLKGIPNSERNHGDVFQSLYDIIDSTLADLKEPPVPPACLPSAKTKSKDRDVQVNVAKFKTVRDVAEDLEAAKIDKAVANEEKIIAVNEAWEAEEARTKRLPTSFSEDYNLMYDNAYSDFPTPSLSSASASASASWLSSAFPASSHFAPIPISNASSYAPVPSSMDSIGSKRSYDGIEGMPKLKRPKVYEPVPGRVVWPRRSANETAILASELSRPRAHPHVSSASSSTQPRRSTANEAAISASGLSRSKAHPRVSSYSSSIGSGHPYNTRSRTRESVGGMPNSGASFPVPSSISSTQSRHPYATRTRESVSGMPNSGTYFSVPSSINSTQSRHPYGTRTRESVSGMPNSGTCFSVPSSIDSTRSKRSYDAETKEDLVRMTKRPRMKREDVIEFGGDLADLHPKADRGGHA